MATTKREATIEDLYAAAEDDRYELVKGELVSMPPAGITHHYTGGEIYSSLKRYLEWSPLGWAFFDGLGYIVHLPTRRSFMPDVSVSNGVPAFTERMASGAPLFAVEIRSPDDYGPKMNAEYAAKRRDYFAAGTVVVWDVDPRTRTVASFRADRPDAPATFRDGDEADAEPALPGWRVAVNALFPPPQPTE